MSSSHSIYANRGLRVGFFIDSMNIRLGCHEKFSGNPNLKKLLDVAVDGNRLVRAVVYAVRMGVGMDTWIGVLKGMGYDVREKEIKRIAGKGKADWDVGICMDIVRMLDMIDVVVLASGDGDFAPLVRYCQERGRIVRVIGTPTSTARVMRELPDEFFEINQDMILHETIRYQVEEKPADLAVSCGAVATASEMAGDEHYGTEDEVSG